MSKIVPTITAIGKYVPEKILTNKDLEKIVDTTDEWITTRTGIKERRIATADQASSDLAAEAFKDMQAKFGVDPKSIDCIVVPTVTPDMFFPSTAALIQKKIGAVNAWGFDLSAACSGFLYALEVASNLLQTGKYKKILVAGAEKMSSITDYTDRNTCVLFGDGAGIVLIEPTTDDTGIIDIDLKMDSIGTEFLYMKAGGSANPASHETVDKKWHYVYQDGRPVYKYAVSRMVQAGVDMVEKHHYTGQDLKLFVPHQANQRIIEACANRLNLRDDQVLSNIHKYANTTAATIPLGLADALEEGRLKKGDLVLLTAFGGGFTWGAALLRWSI
ncbi:MAG: ketoacyl-ACP synthase III [Candidatus Marinimicrobia bacterium]|nr:ketoacyl-ACP synthase III [Candidatus Neomarinimicrobiota bacterium]